MRTRFFHALLCLVTSIVFASPLRASSVLAHEAIIDALWNPSIKPLLIARYPHLSAEQLAEAHGYAYGGSLIQDMGYYPFGSHLFTDLVHYVRSGDFIEALLRDAGDSNEYAFALGAASHFFADTAIHSLAINHAVPLQYPKLRSKFGDDVTYAQAKKEHLLVEFSYDVLHVAAGAYAPQDYHDFIGFQVSKSLLERAFLEVYGLELKDIFFDEELALGTYRRTVSQLIPRMTRVAWAQKRDDIAKIAPGVKRPDFVYDLSRRQYDTEFGRQYKEPGLVSRFLAFLLNTIPKIGPLRALSFKAPNRQMESLFEQSMVVAKQQYSQFLSNLPRKASAIPNLDFDTGRATARGEYSLSDETYARLLHELSGRGFAHAPPELVADIQQFYAVSRDETRMSKKERKRWRETRKELDALQTLVAAGQMGAPR